MSALEWQFHERQRKAGELFWIKGDSEMWQLNAIHDSGLNLRLGNRVKKNTSVTVENGIWTIDYTMDQQRFFCKRIKSKFFKLHRPHCLFCNNYPNSAVHIVAMSNTGKKGYGCVSSKILFTKSVGSSDLTYGSAEPHVM